MPVYDKYNNFFIIKYLIYYYYVRKFTEMPYFIKRQ